MLAELSGLRRSRLATLNFTKHKHVQNSMFPQENLKVALKSVKGCLFS